MKLFFSFVPNNSCYLWLSVNSKRAITVWSRLFNCWQWWLSTSWCCRQFSNKRITKYMKPGIVSLYVCMKLPKLKINIYCVYQYLTKGLPWILQRIILSISQFKIIFTTKSLPVHKIRTGYLKIVTKWKKQMREIMNKTCFGISFFNIIYIEGFCKNRQQVEVSVD